MFAIKKIFLLTILVMLPCFALADSWKIDPAHTSVEFKIRHLMISWVKGVFTDVEGTADFNAADPARSSVKVQIKTASVDTKSKKRDDDLRSPNFFDAATYPIITFISKKVVTNNGQPTEIIGDLTIRDVTREVSLEVEEFSQTVVDPWGNTRRGATATTEIKRKEFGLTWDKVLETGGVMVGNEVRISLEVELIKE